MVVFAVDYITDRRHFVNTGLRYAMDEHTSFSVLTLPLSSAKWHLVTSYLTLRKSVFVDRMNWGLDVDSDLEYEEYDAGPFAHYVIAHQQDKAIAGARLIQCNTERGTGEYVRSYMIRDAALGRIQLPKELWMQSEPPTDEKSWELTRFVSSSTDPDIAKGILEVAFGYMQRLGGKRCICLSAPPMLRLSLIHI